jgi:hypothetical protein
MANLLYRQSVKERFTLQEAPQEVGGQKHVLAEARILKMRARPWNAT